MKKVFIDCGSHYGEGFAEFISILNIDDNWQCYLFEPNKTCFKQIEKYHNNKNIIVMNKAISIADSSVTFRAELAGNTNKYDGVCSTILDSDLYKFNYGQETYEIECINFSNFVKNIEYPSEIYCKMDVEGAEFDILEKMIAEGTISRFKELYVEFHDWTMNPEDVYKTKKEKIIEYCKNNFISLHIWK